jgi:hypothetical protein
MKVSPGLHDYILFEALFPPQLDQQFVSEKLRPMRRTLGLKLCLRTNCLDIYKFSNFNNN